ncbi:MAG: M3 family oligoendopeptidase [Alphaproteobacteria bacterium]
MQALPSWDLTDLYTSQQAPEIDRDLELAAQETEQFVSDFQGKLATASPATLLDAIQRYERIEERLCRLMSYAYLLYATHLNDPLVLQFFQGLQEKATQTSSALVFLTLEINDIDEAALTKAYDNAEIKHYKSWIDRVRLYCPHLLSKEMERFIHDKSVTGRSAWVRLYDETLSQIRCPFGKNMLSISEVLNQMGESDPALRQKAAIALSLGLTERMPLFTLVTNTLAKDKEIEDTWRKYPDPMASRHLANQIEAPVVDALVAATKEHYPVLSHRYYAWKAKFLGKDPLDYWDRNAPLFEEDQKVSWDEAKDIVLDAYRGFSAPMADIAEQFFTNSWIDASLKPGKDSGAFSHSTVPSVHPYIFMNYHGRYRDVTTLAHELGHGIHQTLASSHGLFVADTPLTIAETASVFGEMLTSQALLSKAKDTNTRRALLAGKIDDMLNTVVRQVAFFDFEKQVHEQRRHGEVTADELADIWIRTQGEALGPAVRLDPLIRPFWAYISHFIHAPFYVYAYAFGDCLVNSLYAAYANGFPNFQETYLDMLRAGGSKRYPELLAPFGFQAQDPQFWSQGLGVIASFIEELEAL